VEFVDHGDNVHAFESVDTMQTTHAADWVATGSIVTPG
jgi:hypothetical protein